jgi:hypothetical protein
MNPYSDLDSGFYDQQCKKRFYSVQALGEQRIFITKNKFLFIFIGNKHGLPGAGFITDYNSVET